MKGELIFLLLQEEKKLTYFYFSPEASIALRQRLNETVDELETLKKKSLALEVEHDTLKNELIIAKSDREFYFSEVY